MLLRLTLFILTCIAAARPCFASSAPGYVYTELPTGEQMPVPNVHCIYQDREGFMWYGTRGGGLCRDNGYHIDVFRSDRLHPNLIGKSNDITSITEDIYGNIVFSTKEGLFRLSKTDYTIRPIDPLLTSNPIGALLRASDGKLWVCSGHTIVCYDRQLRRLQVFPSRWKGVNAWASRIMEDSYGHIWITQWNGGVIKYDKQRKTFIEQYWPSGIIPADMVEDTATHSFYIATWGNGIMHYDPLKKMLTSYSCTFTEKNAALIIHLIRDVSAPRLWASTMYGLKAYDIIGGHLVPADIGNAVPKGMSVIDNLAFDRSGNLWVSGFSPHTFILSQPDDAITKNPLLPLLHRMHYRLFIWNTVRDGDNLWIGQDREPLALYKPHTGELLFDRNESNVSRVNVEKFWKRRDTPGIWGIEGQQLYHISYQNGKMLSTAACRARGTIASVCDASRGRVYIGHSRGIDVYNTQTGRIATLQAVRRPIREVLVARNGTVYFATSENVVGSYRPTLGVRTLGQASTISAMTEDKYGAIWIADDQGRLMRCDPKSRRIVTDSKGSSQRGDAIRSLVADSMGHLWIISNQTAKEYNPKSGACRVFRSSDRNIDMDCFLHATPTKDGVCIEGAGGLLYIRSSENLSGRSLTAKPLVTSIAIDGKGMLVGSRQKAVTLPPDAASFEVQLSTLNLLHADKIQYAYRLNGMDDKWHYLPMGLNKAVFVKLPKGKYTLEIMATDEFGRWGQKVQALTLHRLPAWWETTLARLLYLLGAILAVGIGVRIYLARQQEKQQEEMNSKLTEMKISFFTNISHELRTPLTLILTPLESLMHRIGEWRTTDKEDDRWNDIYQRLHVVDNNAQRLLGMVNKLLDFRKIEAGQMVVNLSGGDIYDFIRTTCVPFQELAGEKGIAFVRIIPTQALYVNFDSDKLGHILNNLLSNAFKFTPAGSSVTVKAMTDNDENICITVADKGYGITKQDLPHIFDLYYQSQTVTSHAQPGTGIGLHLTKEYVQLLGGSINVESNAGKGTEFTVRLPLATHDNVAQEVVDIDHEDREAPHILIVDDNREFRNFVVLELGRSYNMLQADNGQEALDIARKQEVDLIVSDVMMPYMDGLELCRQLRNDISLSHIMALLLSAKTSEECKKEGFLAGADDYLCKPFSMEMLLLRIQHLLDMRERRNKRFQQEQSGDMNNITTNDTDRRFLEDAIKQVEQHLMDENYDVDMLAADVNISRSTFYRKIHSLTGLKPTIFIRNIRLKHAARLIREGNHRIIEVADLCGFSSPSYFSRCFHEQYGISPANYKSKKN